MRIVSLLPAASEIVCALGLADDLVGITHACDFPPGLVGRAVVLQPPVERRGARVDGLPDQEAGASGSPEPAAHALPPGVDATLLASLHPDLVLTGPAPRRPGSTAERDRALRESVGDDAAIVTLDPTSLEGIFHAIATVGAMTDAEDEAVGLVEILRERLADVEEHVAERRSGGHHAPRVVALDGLDPLSSAGLWIPEQVRRAGGWEVLAEDGMPSAPTTWEAVAEVDPEMLLLLPCGMHLADAVAAWSAVPHPGLVEEIQALRRGHVFALDGAAYFCRPGPRVIDGIELLAEIFDPDGFVDLAPAGGWVPLP